MVKKNLKSKKIEKKKNTSKPATNTTSLTGEALLKLEARLMAIESKLEVISGVTREYLESQFAKLDEFQKERSQIIKIIDQHESRINTLEGF